MKKHQVRLSLSLVALSGLFLLFQNFSMPIKKGLSKYIPDYKFKEFIGNMEVPSGYTQHLYDLSHKEKPIFDHKQFLKKEAKKTPLYIAAKDVLESLEEIQFDFCDEENFPEECQRRTPRGLASDEVKSHEDSDKTSFKLRANPLKKNASIRMEQDFFSSDINYCLEDQELQVRLSTEIHNRSNLQIQFRSQDQSGHVLWGTSW